MTHIFTPNPHEMGKWRAQAYEAASHLKARAFDKACIKIGFAFDDGIITVTVPAYSIQTMQVEALAEHIYNLVLTAAQTGGTA